MTFFVIIVCILAFCILLVLNNLSAKELFLKGMNFIHDYQQAQPYPFIIVIQNLFSFLCNERGYGLVFLIFYLIVKRKLLMLIHISFFLVVLHLMGILKQTFQEQRPITVNEKI